MICIYTHVCWRARTGVLNQAVPSPLFANGMDVHGRRDSVSRVRGVHAAQAPRLDDRFSWPQVLVRRLLGKCTTVLASTIRNISGHGFPISIHCRFVLNSRELPAAASHSTFSCGAPRRKVPSSLPCFIH